MLTALALLLSAAPTLEHLSRSERSLLQNAIQSYQSSLVIGSTYTKCHENKDYQLLGKPEFDMLESLLAEKLNMSYQDFQTSFTNAQAWQPLKSTDLPTSIECKDLATYQAMLDQYELTRFSLEISEPISKSLLENTATKQASQQNAMMLQGYLQRSSSIALATVVSRQKLSTMEQAKYLHLDYQSNSVFQIKSGWRNIIPHYTGMHIQVTDQDAAQYQGDWLIFLDRQKQFIAALPIDEVRTFLPELGKSDWEFDLSGNLQRH